MTRHSGIHKRPSQVKKLLEYLRTGKGISKRQAMLDFGIANLPGRIYELREMLEKEDSDEEVVGDFVHYKDADGEPKKYMMYRLQKKVVSNE